MSDDCVRRKPNIYEYVLGGEQHPELLEIRLFEESTKSSAYARQTAEAKGLGGELPALRHGYKEQPHTHITASRKWTQTT